MNTTTRLRIGFTITILLGAIWAAVGLFDSLAQVAIGLLLGGAAALALGLVDYLEQRDDEKLAAGRDATWKRRDAQ